MGGAAAARCPPMTRRRRTGAARSADPARWPADRAAPPSDYIGARVPSRPAGPSLAPVVPSERGAPAWAAGNAIAAVN